MRIGRDWIPVGVLSLDHFWEHVIEKESRPTRV